MQIKNNFFGKIKKILKRITKKQWLILGIVLLALIILLIVLLVVKDKGNDKENLANETEKNVINDSQGIIQEATYSGLTINNIILLTNGNHSTFTATVTNNSGEDKNIEDFDIVLKKGDRNVVTLYAYLGDTLKKGESREITASVGMKLPKNVVDNAEYQEHK